jgi:GDPmannose 4,6-dehydratase
VSLNELTKFCPQSPYACAKLYAYWITVNYRNAYKMFASNGILFNHESKRRGETFVTRKISQAAVRIKLGLQDKLYLGNLSAIRDWGHAKDYVEGMWKILQQECADDFVLATGVSASVREFCKKVFEYLDINIEFMGEGKEEKGYSADGKVLVEVDERYFRPTEVPVLIGDYTKAHEKLNWYPKYSLDDIIAEMVDNDYQEIKRKYAVSQDE